MRLLESGIEEAREALDSIQDDEESQGPTDFHILNTNKANSDEDQAMMVSQEIAAAFYEPWNQNIDRLKKGDKVFLYENGQGIIAYGEASGATLSKSHNGDEGACRYQKLSGFKLLATPISAADIKKILGRNVAFLRTMAGMPDGQKILDKLKSIPS